MGYILARDSKYARQDMEVDFGVNLLEYLPVGQVSLFRRWSPGLLGAQLGTPFSSPTSFLMPPIQTSLILSACTMSHYSHAIMSAASIKTLPPSTIQSIASSQVLLDASSVVKELIENAIDANATSIVIELSVNTLDIIQVRDNGRGIAPLDRAAVCKRYTTSKISDFADIRDLGGTSLGFRGEALHSLVEMSGAVSITTRVEGETVAVKLSIVRNGDVEG
jgi:hypothetical protein